MRVLQGNGVGAVQVDPRDHPGAEFMDARRAGGQDEMRQVWQAATALLPSEAERRSGVCEGLLSVRADTLKAKRHVPACGKSGGTVQMPWQVEAKRRAPRFSPSPLPYTRAMSARERCPILVCSTQTRLPSRHPKPLRSRSSRI